MTLLLYPPSVRPFLILVCSTELRWTVPRCQYLCALVPEHQIPLLFLLPILHKATKTSPVVHCHPNQGFAETVVKLSYFVVHNWTAISTPNFARLGCCCLDDLLPFRRWIISTEIQIRDPHKFCDSISRQALGSYLFSGSFFASRANQKSASSPPRST